MKILFIFPHPDDESFGPSTTISLLKREGHQVYLLTLTKGGATKERFKYKYTIEEMGNVRYKEMLEVAKVLDLDGLTVLDLPDSGLKDMDPREIEIVVKNHLELTRPDVVITYAVHGVSGFFDHLVTHAVVKRAYAEMKSNGNEYLRRLAFFTLSEEQAKYASTIFPLKFSYAKDMDCCIAIKDDDIERYKKALDCYVTYEEIIRKSNIKNLAFKEIYYEFFQEDFNPPVNDLLIGLK